MYFGVFFILWVDGRGCQDTALRAGQAKLFESPKQGTPSRSYRDIWSP
jgi:hypothetical protein